MAELLSSLADCAEQAQKEDAAQAAGHETLSGDDESDSEEDEEDMEAANDERRIEVVENRTFFDLDVSYP